MKHKTGKACLQGESWCGLAAVLAGDRNHMRHDVGERSHLLPAQGQGCVRRQCAQAVPPGQCGRPTWRS